MNSNWRKDIKNYIRQIKNQEIEITKEFPDEDNFKKQNYRKCWVTCIFIDICGYTEFCDNNDDKTIGRTIRTFHEGILKIMRKYEIKDIQIQGDGIFGVVHAPAKNDKNDQEIFYSAMEISGYLNFVWKNELDFKIGIESSEELMIVVGNENEREIVFAGGAVNNAKKLLKKHDMKNVILLGDVFVNNNESVLWNKEEKCSYYSVLNGIKYSIWYYTEWEY